MCESCNLSEGLCNAFSGKEIHLYISTFVKDMSYSSYCRVSLIPQWPDRLFNLLLGKKSKK